MYSIHSWSGVNLLQTLNLEIGAYRMVAKYLMLKRTLLVETAPDLAMRLFKATDEIIK